MKKNLFKKSMSVFLSILMLMSAWVWVAPTEASAASKTVGLSALAAISNGSGSRADSGKIVICSDGEAGNTTVGNARFSMAAIPENASKVTLNLSTGNHGGTLVSGASVKVFLINPSKCQATSIGHAVNNIASVYGSNYNAQQGVTNAYNYYGVTESQALYTFSQNSSSHSIDVTNAVNTARANGWSDLCFAFIMPAIYNDGNGNSWSDTHINVSGTNLTCEYEPVGQYYIRYVVNVTSVSNYEKDYNLFVSYRKNNGQGELVKNEVLFDRDSISMSNTNDYVLYEGYIDGFPTELWQHMAFPTNTNNERQMNFRMYIGSGPDNLTDYSLLLTSDNNWTYNNKNQDNHMAVQPGFDPYQNSITGMSSLSVDVGKDGTGQSSVTTGTVYDQYGVQWYQAPTYTLSSSSTSQVNVSGAQVVTSGKGAYVKVTNLANLSGYNPSTGKATLYLRATSGSASASVPITITAPKYSMTFSSPDGATEVGTKTYNYNQPIGTTLPVPSRPGYTFSGWWVDLDGNGSQNGDEGQGKPLAGEDGSVRDDLQNFGITKDWALISLWRANTYTITWVDGDGKTIKTEQVAYGSTPSYTGDTPTKTATEQYSYTFNGNWSPAITAVTGNATYTAQFDSTVNKYTVTWKNHDGMVLETDENVPYGTIPAYNGATPTKAADVQYSYTHNGWSPEVTAVTGDATYTAQFAKNLNKYTVRFLNDDGTELQRSTLEYGEMPVYNGKTPTKAETDQYTYTFDDWDKEITTVTSSVDYKATYTAATKEYTITWVDGDGNTLQTDTVAYGATPSYTGDTPTKTATKQYTYTFNDTWTPAIATVTGNATYTAQFNSAVNSYTVTWKNHDGTILETDTVEYGEMPSYDGAAPTKAGNAQYSYAFAGWDNEIATVTGDVTYTATYTESTNSYTVIWANEDGTVLEKDENVLYGSVPSYDGATPTKAATAQYTYTYKSWDKAISEVTGDVTYTAVYDSVVNEYTITFKNENGDVLQSGPVEYGETPEYSGATPTKTATAQYTYTFDKWSPAIESVTGEATYTATYTATVNKYTVKFVNEDGTELQSSEVAYGQTPAYTGETPTKAATAQYTYTFAGWTPTISEVTGNVTYTAAYTATVNKYTVKFVDEDGVTVLDEQTLEYGKMPEYKGKTPTKAQTVEYSYTFDKWSPAIAAVTGDATYTATYKATKRSYEVTFVDEDGTRVLYTDYFKYGSTPAYVGENPVKASTAQYSYTFAGWTPAITAVTGVATYKATYTEAVRNYNVTWVDGNGKTLETDSVAYGETPAYTGNTPTKAADAQYTYTFAGWTPEVVAVTGDVTYTAQFDSTVNSYTITWLNDDESVIDTTTVEYGTVPTHADATKAATDEYTYTFAGWTPEVVAVTGNATYKATFTATKNSYTITWLNDDDSLIDTTTVEYGEVPTHTDATKAATDEYTYTFAGWSPEVVAVTGDATYKATFTAEKRSYTITWKNDDGTTIDTTTVKYGEVPTHDDATKAATVQYTYTFAGWTPEVVAVTGDASYTATYSSTVNKYVVKFVDEDGTELQSSEVAYGETPAYTGATPTKAATAQYTYTFAGWDAEITPVTGEATYKATYSDTTNEYTVTFENEDGTELQSSEVAYGEMPAYEGETPTKAADAQYTYTFAGWTPAIVAVTGDVTYKAIYKSTVNEYTIKFVNEDGTELQSGKVAYGETPVYNGATPTKAATAQYTYTFAGWGEITPVTGDATYTAQFDSAVNEYTIKFVDEDGTELQSSEVAYGETPAYTGETPTKAADSQSVYAFDGWTPEVVAVTGDATYTAKYSSVANEYEIKFKNINGEIVKSEKVAYGEKPVAPENSVIKYDEHGHHSYAWPELETVTSAFTYIEVETIVGHTPAVAVEENKTDSTCYKTGSYDEVVYCSLDECQFEISRTEKTIELKEHTPGEAVIENEIKATCTTDGSYDKVVYCSVEECKKVLSKETVTILALNHKNKVHHEKVEATCAETGTIEYWSCPDCSKNFSDADCTAEVTDITIAKNAENHVEIKEVEAKEPSCTEVGYDAYEYCTGCTYTTYTEIPQKGHTPVPGEYKAPTCISEGYEGATICDVCKVEITAGKPIDKLAHEFGNTPVQVIPENCTYEATYVYKCKFCTETNKVGGEAKPEGDKGPHTIVELEKIEPTCDTAGIYSYYCSTCGGAVKTETIDPIGHADKDGDGYCDNCGGKYFDPNNQSVCTCLCHKESGFMKFLYKIANFFWKLFKINKSCACGYVHY